MSSAAAPRCRAQSLGVTEHEVVKTLVMQDEDGKPLIVLMHGDRKVSTKNLARQAGVKAHRAVRARRGAAPLRLPGRRHLALRHAQPMPVYMERSILELPQIYINGGRRGFLVRISPKEILRTLQPQLVDVALED